MKLNCEADLLELRNNIRLRVISLRQTEVGALPRAAIGTELGDITVRKASVGMVRATRDADDILFYGV